MPTSVPSFPQRPVTAAAPAASRPLASVQPSGGGRLITSSAELEEYLRGRDGGTASGAVVSPETALRVGTVYGCVRIIAGKVATLPIDVRRRVNDTTRESVGDHPVAKLLKRGPARAWPRPAVFRRLMQTHVLLRGYACARKVIDGRGNVVDLIPLHPDRVKPRQRDDLTLEFEYRRPDGGTVTLPHRDVFYLVGMTLDGVVGVSVLRYAREAIGLSIATTQHGAAFFRNGARVSEIITHPTHLGKEAIENLRASLDEFRAGGTLENKALVLEEGAKIEQLGMNAEDAQFVETMKLSRTDIGMFFGVPPHMLGDTEKSTSWGTGIEQQSAGFVAYTLEDWLTMWEEAINADLFQPRETDIYARFERNALVRGDIKARWDAYVKGLQWGVVSPDEVRANEDMNPREDGQGGRYYEPPNTAGGSSEKDKPDEPAQTP